MDIPFLYALPVYQLFAVVAAAFLVYTTLIFFTIRILLGQKVFFEDGAALSAMARPVASLFAVLVALMSVGTLNNFNAAKDVVHKEAGILNVIQKVASMLPAEVQRDVQHTLVGYMINVIEVEWPSMATSAVVNKAEENLEQFYTTAKKYHFDDSTQNKEFEQLLGQMDELDLIHQKRLNMASEGFPAIVLGVVVCAGCLVIVTTSFSVMRSRLTQFVAISCVALAISLLVTLVIAFDYPFRGGAAIGNEPIRQQLKLLQH